MVARDLLEGEASKYLDRLVVLIAPVFNPDGNEKISTTNRPTQNGPAGGVGVRVNGQNLDLNRDGIKLETPEVRGLVQNVLGAGTRCSSSIRTRTTAPTTRNR